MSRTEGWAMPPLPSNIALYNHPEAQLLPSVLHKPPPTVITETDNNVNNAAINYDESSLQNSSVEFGSEN